MKIMKGATPGLSMITEMRVTMHMLSISEQIRGIELHRGVELRMCGWRPYWNAVSRPLPVSAFNEVFPAWDIAMRNGRQPMTDADRLEMIAYHRFSFLNATQGTASDKSWGCLALASNLCLILAELGYGEEWIPLIQEAQDGLMRAKDRGDRLGSWRMDGAGLATVGDMLDVFDAQLEIAPRMAITEARDIILQRMADNEILELAQK